MPQAHCAEPATDKPALPRKVTHFLAASAVLVALGTGATFAIASLGPDPARVLDVRQVEIPVPSLASDVRVETLALPDLPLFRTERSRQNDTVDSILQRLNVADPQAAEFMRRNTLVYQSLPGRVGRMVTAETAADHSLQKLTARWVASSTHNTFQRLVVEKDGDGQFTSRLEEGELQASTRLVSGTIQSSLYGATDALNIPDAVANQVAEIFSPHIDFRRDLRKGDRFSIVYETLEADGEPMRSGRVLSAEFVNKGKAFDAVWYAPEGSRGGYFTLDGESHQRAYLTSPLAFTRVTSNFAPRRFHPIQKKWKAHLGTDFGAPTGTSVRVVGDGVVEFAGVQNGYGNVIYVRHPNKKHTTVYAHLSKIHVKKGQHVSQGDNIGAVGMTGWATGPHLHFEFRIDGKHQDPMKIARESEAVRLPASARADFDRYATIMRASLEAASSLQLAVRYE